ncbi:cell division protein FtsL [Candidatus Allofournierella excrementigallinarum]|uniref:cell division protein FtsL n=1 Tax=Candidatus Allofournierella excrementigallinarum TaxID=2838592 RepID=UPI00374F18F7
MAQPAYDLELFENRAQRPRAKVRAVRGKKRASRLNLQTVKTVAVAVVMAALVVGFLYSQATITELTVDIQNVQSDLVSEQSTYNYLSGVLDSKTSLRSVEQIAAGELGLVKVDRSQVTYFSLESESVINRPETAAQKITEFLNTGLLSLMEYLNP